LSENKRDCKNNNEHVEVQRRDTKLFIKLDDDNVGLKAIEINKSVEIKEKSAKEIGIDSLFVDRRIEDIRCRYGRLCRWKMLDGFIEKVLSEIMEYSLYWSTKMESSAWLSTTVKARKGRFGMQITTQ
jgi:hypothetical protein